MIKKLLLSLIVLLLVKTSSDSLKAETNPRNLGNLILHIDFFSANSDTKLLSADSIKYSLYVIYDSKGERVKSATSSAGIRELNESLPEGVYKVVIFASDKALNFHIADNLADLPGFIHAGSSIIYHKAMDLTITSKATVQNVMLDRLSSLLELKFIDSSLPSGISEVQFNWTDRKYISFEGKAITNSLKQKTINTQDGKRPESFSTLIFNTETPINLHINYKDKEGNLLKGKTIENIVCLKNGQTTLTGFLFNDTSKDFAPIIAGDPKL